MYAVYFTHKIFGSILNFRHMILFIHVGSSTFLSILMGYKFQLGARAKDEQCVDDIFSLSW